MIINAEALVTESQQNDHTALDDKTFDKNQTTVLNPPEERVGRFVDYINAPAYSQKPRDEYIERSRVARFDLQDLVNSIKDREKTPSFGDAMNQVYEAEIDDPAELITVLEWVKHCFPTLSEHDDGVIEGLAIQATHAARREATQRSDFDASTFDAMTRAVSLVNSPDTQDRLLAVIDATSRTILASVPNAQTNRHAAPTDPGSELVIEAQAAHEAISDFQKQLRSGDDTTVTFPEIVQRHRDEIYWKLHDEAYKRALLEDALRSHLGEHAERLTTLEDYTTDVDDAVAIDPKSLFKD